MSSGELAPRLAKLADRLTAELDDKESALVIEALIAQPKKSRTYGLEDLGEEACARLQAIARLERPRASLASRALIARLCEQNWEGFGRGLPSRVRERSTQTLEWLVPWLAEERDDVYAFPADEFVKDYRFATGLTVPCGAQVVDLAERPGRKTVLALASRSLKLALRAATHDWFRPHTEGRYLEEFNEEGWNRCYHEVAALLRSRQQVAGMIATSWFYDPALQEISPRLDYLRRVPVSGGAIPIRHGTTQFDIDSSTKTSPTRRALFEAGLYLPECWSIVWPRAEMLAWSGRNASA